MLDQILPIVIICYYYLWIGFWPYACLKIRNKSVFYYLAFEFNLDLMVMTNGNPILKTWFASDLRFTSTQNMQNFLRRGVAPPNQ